MTERLTEPMGFPEGLQDSEETSSVRDAPGVDENDREKTSRDPELQNICSQITGEWRTTVEVVHLWSTDS